MTKLKTLDDLKDLAVYKKDLKADLALLKETPTALSWVEMFQFNGGKREAAVLLGAVPDSLEKAIKDAGKAIKVGKCKRNKADEVEIVSGGLKPGLLAALFKTIGLAEKVCETVGGAASGGIDDDTAEAVGAMLNRAAKPSEDEARRIADKLTTQYEALHKKFGPVFTLAKEFKVPTAAFIDAERAVDTSLKRRSVEIADDVEAATAKIEAYQQAGASLATLIQRERDADSLKKLFEGMQGKFETVFENARRLKLPTAEFTRGEVAVQAELRKTSAEIVATADKVKGLILTFGQAGKALADAIADHQQKEADARKREEERDRQWMEGSAKKKDAAPKAPRKEQGGNGYKPLDLGAPLTFKQKFARKMIQREPGVIKDVNNSDYDGGFSTYYSYAQGTEAGAYEIHVHRDPEGKYKSAQVKTGRKAKILHGGEEKIFPNELATYGIPPVETPPT